MIPARISASLMCADPLYLEQTVRSLENSGVEYLHIDVMDGCFVPNFALSADFCRLMKQITSIPLDLHLMITQPEKKIGWFPVGAGNIVSVHAESTRFLKKAIKIVSEQGAVPFIAINPATPFRAIENVIESVKGVLVMCVNPGFAGQKIAPGSFDKIKEIRTALDKAGYENISVEVDGNVSFENAVKMRAAGADLFVAGTSSVFHPSFDIEEGTNRLRKAIVD